MCFPVYMKHSVQWRLPKWKGRLFSQNAATSKKFPYILVCAKDGVFEKNKLELCLTIGYSSVPLVGSGLKGKPPYGRWLGYYASSSEPG